MPYMGGRGRGRGYGRGANMAGECATPGGRIFGCDGRGPHIPTAWTVRVS